jgi:hypothetical protein
MHCVRLWRSSRFALRGTAADGFADAIVSQYRGKRSKGGDHGLVERKAVATEQSTTPRIGKLDNFIAGVLAETASRFKLPDQTQVLPKANALFASLLQGEVTE